MSWQLRDHSYIEAEICSTSGGFVSLTHPPPRPSPTFRGGGGAAALTEVTDIYDQVFSLA